MNAGVKNVRLLAASREGFTTNYPYHAARPRRGEAPPECSDRRRVSAFEKERQFSCQGCNSVLYLFLYLLKETAELSASVDAIRAAAVRNRSMDARAEGRAGRVGLRLSEPRRSGPRDRVAGGPEGRNASRREMASQSLEKIESGPGNGMAPAASVPQDIASRACLRRADMRQERVCDIPGRESGAAVMVGGGPEN